MSLSIPIPKVTRDDRIGSVFNELFSIIHNTKNGAVWNFDETKFLHPFFIAPLSIYKDCCKYTITCNGMSNEMKNYFNAIHFEDIYDASDLRSKEDLKNYFIKSYIPISRFLIRNNDIDKIQEVLQGVIQEQSKISQNMRTPISHLLSELVGNISEHSSSEYGYLYCQCLQKELYIVIADTGKTIYNSYVDTNKYIDEIGTDEAKALLKANDGYSTKDRPEAENRGYGISKSREMVVNGLKGGFFMLSGTAFYRHNDNNINAVNIPEDFRWNGTIILLRIPTEAPTDFEFYNYVEG